MATTRVYILAKELGVKSTAIVEKCQAEGLDVRNHMATISAGLAATIREWFTEGDQGTAVETAEKVDLSKVRVKKPRKAAKPSESDVALELEEVTESVDELEVEEANLEDQPETLVEELVDQGIEKAQEDRSEQAEASAVEEPKPEAEISDQPPVTNIIAEKKKPVITPAGPVMHKPEPAQLAGPRIVRVEAPEPTEQPRRGPRRKPAAPAPSRPKPVVPAPAAQIQPVVGVDVKHKKTKRTKEEEAAEEIRKAKFIKQRRQRDIEERRARLDAATGGGMRFKPRKVAKGSGGQHANVIERPTKAVVTEPIFVKDLSAAIGVRIPEIITKLMSQGVMATANQAISKEVSEMVALEFGTELEVQHKVTIEEELRKEFEVRQRPNPTRRPVIATMLGHVDHGKTSLLDAIRKTQVAAGEAGGITQHVSAYQIEHNGGRVTFIDTPGHAAFTAMRARGANMTDIVVLVVAADDGVMPQTVEVINHAKAANVPVLIALNKIDLPGMDINRIYAQLSEHNLVPTEWGGSTEVVKTSATTGQGIDELLEHLDYVSELLELKADDTIPAQGWVVEAEMTSQKGVLATVLIKEGVLNKGDIILAGGAYGRIKAMHDSFGRIVKKATSSMPVEVTGLNEVPSAGERFYVLQDINRAKAAAEQAKSMERESSLATRSQITLENLFSHIEAGDVKELNLIVRADVQGSVDVLYKYLTDLSTQEVKIKILHAATGGITEGDVVLAEASNAIIIGFNVVPEERVAKIAESKGIDIRLYTIIYRITEDLEKSMVGLLEPEKKEQKLGRATVKSTFKVSKVGTIAGCFVNDGIVKKSAKARLIRDNVVVRDELWLESLKHFKDDVREVKSGFECGIKLAKFDDIKVDDILDFYEIVEVARSLR